jgi:alpha,alpha-trehalase
MRRAALQCVCGLAMLASTACAQTPQREPIGQYIHQSWDKLSRSTTDCASLVDPKITTTPVLYIAYNERMPKAVTEMKAHCKIDVRRLPRQISAEGDVLPGDLPVQGLLYLPNRYVVPGGRFNEMYGWDSYFILLGEIADGRLDLARGTVENFFYELDFYGAILNANRTYYLTRSQPPFLSSMVMEVYRAEAAKDPKEALKFLRHAERYLERDYDTWISDPHLAGTTGLSRYFDIGNGPVPEERDNGVYYRDIIHWLEAHPKEAPLTYLQRARSERPCTQANGQCPVIEVNGQELSDSFYQGDRAMRESGFDTSFRFGPFSGATQDYAPICLNALLFKYERDLAFINLTLGDRNAAFEWSSAAGVRRAVVEEQMWNEKAGLFVDYNARTRMQSKYPFLTTYYALWSGLASPEEAKRLAANLPLFERKGGLQTSTYHSGEQWDAPFGWAPINWLAVSGLERYGFDSDARRIAREFTSTVAANYERDGTIREKYNMETASSDVVVNAGYHDNVIGFGWTNGVYLKLEQLLAAPAKH